MYYCTADADLGVFNKFGQTGTSTKKAPNGQRMSYVTRHFMACGGASLRHVATFQSLVGAARHSVVWGSVYANRKQFNMEKLKDEITKESYKNVVREKADQVKHENTVEEKWEKIMEIYTTSADSSRNFGIPAEVTKCAMDIQ